jgi:hypothetical protein
MGISGHGMRRKNGDGKGCKKKTRRGTKQDGNRNESRRIVIDRKIVDGKEGNLQV